MNRKRQRSLIAFSALVFVGGLSLLAIHFMAPNILNPMFTGLSAQDAMTSPPPEAAATWREGFSNPQRSFPINPGRSLTAPVRTALEDRPELTAIDLPPRGLEGKVVALTFFASWCVPCRQELAQLKWLHAKYGRQGLVIVAVNTFETFDGLSDRARLNRFLDRIALPFPVIPGDEGLSETFGGITRIPTLLVYDRQGRPALRFGTARSTRDGGIGNISPARSTTSLTDLEAAVQPLL